jgi:hypothetical protein
LQFLAFDVADIRLQICTALLVVQSVLRAWGARELSGDDIEAANALYSWIASNLLPSSEFAEALEAAYSADSRFFFFFCFPSNEPVLTI